MVFVITPIYHFHHLFKQLFSKFTEHGAETKKGNLNHPEVLQQKYHKSIVSHMVAFSSLYLFISIETTNFGDRTIFTFGILTLAYRSSKIPERTI